MSSEEHTARKEPPITEALIKQDFPEGKSLSQKGSTPSIMEEVSTEYASLPTGRDKALGLSNAPTGTWTSTTIFEVDSPTGGRPLNSLKTEELDSLDGESDSKPSAIPTMVVEDTKPPIREVKKVTISSDPDVFIPRDSDPPEKEDYKSPITDGSASSYSFYKYGITPYVESVATQGHTRIECPVLRPSDLHNSRDKEEEFILLANVTGNLRSRRYMASHYGMAVAGYVVPVSEYEDFRSSAIAWQIPEITLADPLLGIAHDCFTVVQDERGLWPFGVIGSKKVVWLPLPGLGKCQLTNPCEYKIVTMGVKIELPTSARACIAQISRGERVENWCCIRDGKPARVRGKAVAKDSLTPLAYRNTVIIANGVSRETPIYDGPYPNLHVSRPSDEEEEYPPYYTGTYLRDHCERSLSDSPTECEEGEERAGFVYDLKRRYYFSAYQGYSFKDSDERISKLLCHKGPYELPGFEMHASTLDELNGDQVVEAFTLEESNSNGPGVRVAGPKVSIVLPGSTPVHIEEGSVLRCVNTPPSVVPFCAAPVHPHSRIAQCIYNKCVAGAEISGVWAVLELPTRTVARSSVRPRYPKTGSIHPGDEIYGDVIANHLIVKATPRIFIFEPDANAGKIPHGEAALQALVRSAYAHGSSVLGDEEFIKTTVKGTPQAPKQTYAGLTETGEVEYAFHEKDDVQILHHLVKEGLDEARRTPETLRSFTAKLLDNYSLAVSIPVSGASDSVTTIETIQTAKGSAEELFEIPLNRKLTSPQAQKLMSILGIQSTKEEVIERFQEMGPSLLQLSSESPGISIYPEREYLETSDPILQESFFGTLLGSRIIRRQTDLKKHPPSKFKNSARSNLKKGLLKFARLSLLKLLGESSPPIDANDELWKESLYTFEVANIGVSEMQADSRTTWGTILYHCKDFSPTPRVSMGAASNAAAVHDRSLDRQNKVPKGTSSAVSSTTEEEDMQTLAEAFSKKVKGLSMRRVCLLLEKHQKSSGVDKVYRALTGKDPSYLKNLTRGTSTIAALASQISKGEGTFESFLQGRKPVSTIPNPFVKK